MAEHAAILALAAVVATGLATACHGPPAPAAAPEPASQAQLEPGAAPERLILSFDDGRPRIHAQLTDPGTLILDDDPEPGDPLWSGEVGPTVELRSVPGLSPQGPLFAWLDGRPLAVEITVERRGPAQLDYDYLRRAWAASGRAWIESHSGLRHVDDRWVPGPGPTRENAQALYYVEYVSEPAVHTALTCGDTQLRSELADLYLALLERTETLAALADHAAREDLDASLLRERGPATSRTFGWIEPTPSGERMRECVLCSSQLWFPAARLARGLSAVPRAELSTLERQFLARVVPFLVSEHIERLVYEVQWDHWGEPALRGPLIDHWAALLDGTPAVERRFHAALFDRDLWLIASAAELLVAHQNAPELVALEPAAVERLERASTLGSALLASRMNPHPETRDFQGQRVGSVGAFEGELVDHPAHAHAGRLEPARPDTPASAPDSSWDIAHVARLPVVLRSLYACAPTLGLAFPDHALLAAVARQFSHRVFDGDFDAPGFRNYFDGGDGWYRVEGEHGYPPHLACDSADPERPCLAAGGLRGWGMLAFAEPSLHAVLDATLAVATRDDPRAQTLAAHRFALGDEPFSIGALDGTDGPRYPVLLLWLLGARPEVLAGCLDARDPRDPREARP